MSNKSSTRKKTKVFYNEIVKTQKKKRKTLDLETPPMLMYSKKQYCQNGHLIIGNYRLHAIPVKLLLVICVVGYTDSHSINIMLFLPIAL